jgi:hypothetical protein
VRAKQFHMNYFRVMYTTHITSVFAGDNFNSLMRVDFLHLFSRGMFGHVINKLIALLDTRQKNTTINVTSRNNIKSCINYRSASTPTVRGFNKRFSNLKTGLFYITTPWAYQYEAVFIYAPHLFTIELLTHNNFLTRAEAIQFISIVIDMRTLAFSVEPLINRVFSIASINNLKIIAHRLRQNMRLLLPKMKLPKNHWLTTMIHKISAHGVGQCDYNESLHL